MIYPWQNTQWQQLQRQIREDRLAHALLLSGPAGTGKQQFARALIRSMLCRHASGDGRACGTCEACRLYEAGTHPDARWLQPVAPDKTASDNPVMLIRTGMVEDLVGTLSATSQFGGYRCAVIAEAEKMNREAANRLLKTLEEPGAATLIVLVSSHPSRLPITLRSRCQLKRFPVPAPGQARQWLASVVSDSTSEIKQMKALKLSHDAPLLARRYLQEWDDMHEVLAKALLAGGEGKAVLSHAQELSKLPKTLALSWLLDWAGDLARLQIGGAGTALVHEDLRTRLAASADQADTGRLFGFYDHVCDLLRVEAIALNPQLMWENLLISWDAIRN